MSFDESGQVNGWNNHRGVLNAGMQEPKSDAKAIKIGSTKEEVLKAFGSPEKIIAESENRWYYGFAWFSFDQSEHVDGWNNHRDTFGDKVIE